MKLHRPLVEAVVKSLDLIFFQNNYADKVVEIILKQNSRWGSRDRRFIAGTIYEIVRWWRYLGASANIESPETQNDIWKIFAAYSVLNTISLPDWDEFENSDQQSILNKAEQLKSIRKYRESIPDWMDELGCQELGESSWTTEIHELNKEAQVVLRVNTLKTDSIRLQRSLAGQLIETVTIDGYPDALILKKRQHLHHLQEYKNGLFEIQDASSQLIAPFLQAQPGMTIIDACAGAGGKSLHVAAMMRNKGKIIAMDVEEKKLKELEKRAQRAGTTIIQTQLIHSNTINKLRNTADRLLLDVPCSGLGVLRRNPDAKWKLSPVFIEQIRQTQQQIITSYSQMLKPEGIMVYATCSILSSENEKQVQEFLNKNKNFEFIADRKVFPSEGFDGFYMAKLMKIKE